MVQLLAVALEQEGPEFKSEDGQVLCFVLKCACSLQVLPQSNNINVNPYLSLCVSPAPPVSLN